MLRFGSLVLMVLATAARGFAQSPPAGDYKVNTWHLGGPGRWDYVTVDPLGQRLYVPRSTHTMVIDTATGKPVADIPGQQQNHGVAIASDVGRGFISDGRGASVAIFDLKTHAGLGLGRADDDADGIIYDPSSHKILVVCGDARA